MGLAPLPEVEEGVDSSWVDVSLLSVESDDGEQQENDEESTVIVLLQGK